MRHRRKLSNWQKAHRNLHHHLSLKLKLVNTDVSAKVRVDVFVSSAESRFQRREGENGMISGTAALLYPTTFGGLLYMSQST